MIIESGLSSLRAAIEIGPGARPGATQKRHGEQIALPPRLWRLAASRLAGVVLLTGSLPVTQAAQAHPPSPVRGGRVTAAAAHLQGDLSGSGPASLQLTAAHRRRALLSVAAAGGCEADSCLTPLTQA